MSTAFSIQNNLTPSVLAIVPTHLRDLEIMKAGALRFVVSYFYFPGCTWGSKISGVKEVFERDLDTRNGFFCGTKTADQKLCSSSCHKHLVARCHIENW